MCTLSLADDVLSERQQLSDAVHNLRRGERRRVHARLMDDTADKTALARCVTVAPRMNLLHAWIVQLLGVLRHSLTYPGVLVCSLLSKPWFQAIRSRVPALHDGRPVDRRYKKPA